MSLQRVLLNLLTNSIDAPESAGNTLKRIHVAATLRPDGMVEVSVSDTGVGLEGVDHRSRPWRPVVGHGQPERRGDMFVHDSCHRVAAQPHQRETPRRIVPGRARAQIIAVDRIRRFGPGPAGESLNRSAL